MIKEEYVSFEVARLLKEKEFNEKLLTFYVTDEDKKEGCFQIMAFSDDKIDNNYSDYCYLAPTLQMAMKWLREVHNLYIQPKITAWPQKGYFVKIYLYNNRYNNFEEVSFVEHKESYEETCEAAIKYCLEHLI